MCMCVCVCVLYLYCDRDGETAGCSARVFMCAVNGVSATAAVIFQEICRYIVYADFFDRKMC